MKILRVEERKGEYSLDGDDYKSIVDIRKEDIQQLLTIIMIGNEDVEVDDLSNGFDIANGAERIVYEQILSSIKKLIGKRDEIKLRVEMKYEAIKAKYLMEQ